MPKRFIGGLVAALVLWPAAASGAGPSDVYARVLRAYQTTGSIPACRFTSQQLSAALGDVDTYGQQYFADFISAIQTALAARATGGCSKKRHRIASVSGGRLATGLKLPTSVTAATSAGVPAPLIALGIAAAALACAAGLSVLVGRRGTPAGWRHGWAEARYRAADALGPPRRRR